MSVVQMSRIPDASLSMVPMVDFLFNHGGFLWSANELLTDSYEIFWFAVIYLMFWAVEMAVERNNDE